MITIIKNGQYPKLSKILVIYVSLEHSENDPVFFLWPNLMR